MKKLVENFPSMLREGIEIAQNITTLVEVRKIQNIVITGLGGSGIGGTIIQKLVEQNICVPVVVNKGYFLPQFVAPNTLVIACSYSGNTEETLQAYSLALQKKAQIVCITSGGELQKLAKQNNHDCIIIPGGLPPRAAFAYPFAQLVGLLVKLNLIEPNFWDDFKQIPDYLIAQQPEITSIAENIGKQIHTSIPVIYAEDSLEGVAVRLRQQINENAKMLCWHHVVPELNHNEIVGWTSKNAKLAVLFLTTTHAFYRNEHRLKYLEKVISPLAGNVFHIKGQGNTHLKQVFYLIHLGDWLSVKIAEVKQIDPMEVKVIENLKVQLSQLK